MRGEVEKKMPVMQQFGSCDSVTRMMAAVSLPQVGGTKRTPMPKDGSQQKHVGSLTPLRGIQSAASDGASKRLQVNKGVTPSQSHDLGASLSKRSISPSVVKCGIKSRALYLPLVNRQLDSYQSENQADFPVTPSSKSAFGNLDEGPFGMEVSSDSSRSFDLPSDGTSDYSSENRNCETVPVFHETALDFDNFDDVTLYNIDDATSTDKSSEKQSGSRNKALQWNKVEEDKLVALQNAYGNKWTIISKQLHPRTALSIKNKWWSMKRKTSTSPTERSTKKDDQGKTGTSGCAQAANAQLATKPTCGGGNAKKRKSVSGANEKAPSCPQQQKPKRKRRNSAVERPPAYKNISVKTGVLPNNNGAASFAAVNPMVASLLNSREVKGPESIKLEWTQSVWLDLNRDIPADWTAAQVRQACTMSCNDKPRKNPFQERNLVAVRQKLETFAQTPRPKNIAFVPGSLTPKLVNGPTQQFQCGDDVHSFPFEPRIMNVDDYPMTGLLAELEDGTGICI